MLSTIFDRARSLVSRPKTEPEEKEVKVDPPLFAPDPNAQVRVIPMPYQGVSTSETALLKDDSVWAVYNLFRDILLGAGWRFEGDDAEAAEELLEAVVGVNGFDDMLHEMAAARFQRMAVTEIIWNYGETWLPRRYRVLPIDCVTVDLNDEGEPESLNVSTSAGPQKLPLANAVLFRWRPTLSQPLGQSVYVHIEEVVEYKRTLDKAMVSFAKRWGVPSIIGYYQPNQDKTAQNRLLSVLKAFQNACVGVLPMKPSKDAPDPLQILEAKGDAAIAAVIDMNKMMERRIARSVLGSILAVFESEYGTRAQAQTHLEVLRAVVESSQAPLEGAINEQLIQPVLRLNGLGTDVRWVLNAPNMQDLEKLGNMVADLSQAGLIDPQQDAKAIRNIFGIDTPDDWVPPSVGPATALPPADPGTDDDQ